MTYEEYCQMHKQYPRLCFIEAMKLAYSGKWEEFCRYIITHHEAMEPAITVFFKDMPNELKYQFLIDCYAHHGDSIPVVRKYVRQMRKWGNPELPHCMEILDEITIFRAGAEDLTKAKYRISWTHDINTAIFFLKRSQEYENRRLYAGRIKKEKILAYNNDRSEYEVMQYSAVYDIHDITRWCK